MSADDLTAIDELRKARNAVILSHSYQPPEIQDLADYVGDSLGLSRQAASTDAEVIVFCGVRFMAETAHVLSPEKTVLLPEPKAGCPLADCMSADDLRAMKKRYPDAPAVTYINSSVEVKAESYACCTSANALEVVESAPGSEVIFGPDYNLGMFVSRLTSKKIHVYRGACLAHARADLEDLVERQSEYPDAETLVHPETPPEFWDKADRVLGTGGMISRVKSSEATRFIIGTEEGMVYRLKTLYPDREFIAGGEIHCINMKKIDTGKVRRSLQELRPSIAIAPELRERALMAVERMTGTGS